MILYINLDHQPDGDHSAVRQYRHTLMSVQLKGEIDPLWPKMFDISSQETIDDNNSSISGSSLLDKGKGKALLNSDDEDMADNDTHHDIDGVMDIDEVGEQIDRHESVSAQDSMDVDVPKSATFRKSLRNKVLLSYRAIVAKSSSSRPKSKKRKKVDSYAPKQVKEAETFTPSANFVSGERVIYQQILIDDLEVGILSFFFF